MSEHEEIGDRREVKLPASMMLHKALDDKISELGPIESERARAAGYNPQGDGFVGLRTDKMPLKIGDIDEVKVESLMRDNDGSVSMGLFLFSDVHHIT